MTHEGAKTARVFNKDYVDDLFAGIKYERLPPGLPPVPGMVGALTRAKHARDPETQDVWKCLDMTTAAEIADELTSTRTVHLGKYVNGELIIKFTVDMDTLEMLPPGYAGRQDVPERDEVLTDFGYGMTIVEEYGRNFHEPLDE